MREGPAPRGMQAWDYYTEVIPFGAAASLESALSECGAAAWELVNVLTIREGWLAIFKRPRRPILVYSL